MSETELTSVENVSLASKWFHLLRLHMLHRGVRYGILWTTDLFVRLTWGVSPARFTEITPHLHVGGQYLRWGLPKLMERGITAVVNMRDEFDDARAGIAPDEYLHLPTVDNTPPTLADLRQGVDFIRQQVEADGRVYVHCEAGVGRAPTMAAAYLIDQGMAPESAWDLLRRQRPFIRPTPTQVKQIQRFARGQPERNNSRVRADKEVSGPRWSGANHG